MERQMCTHVLIGTTLESFEGATISQSLGLKPKARGIKQHEPCGVCSFLPLPLKTTGKVLAL